MFKFLKRKKEKEEKKDKFILQGSFYLTPICCNSLVDILTFYAYTNGNYVILESELPVSFVLNYKGNVYQYITPLIAEIEALTFIIRKERNSILTRLRKELILYIDFYGKKK